MFAHTQRCFVNQLPQVVFHARIKHSSSFSCHLTRMRCGRYPLGIGGVDCRLLRYHVLPEKQLGDQAQRLQAALLRGPSARTQAALPALQEADDAQTELQQALSGRR